MTKAWVWSKNTSEHWLIPCMESSYLAERWSSQGFLNFLDVGCGLGRHSIYMAKHGFDVSTIDLSEQAVKHTLDWAEKENLDVKTCVSNMLHLPFADNAFDCIMAYNVIYHTDTNGFRTALKEIRRVLKPNGELFLTLISKNTYSYLRANTYTRIDDNTILRNEDETERDVPHFYVNIEDIKKLFVDFGYVRLPIEWCEYKMENPESYSKHWSLLVRKSGESDFL
jgi:2-polyprenyl-3-methyl-5-hydroxy-6-metoxy-1,4-benzoquinol methylase